MLARSVIRPTLIWSCSHACSSSRPWARVGALDGVANLLRALQLHRVGPAVALIHDVTQAVEGFLIARRRDIQAAARAQLQTQRAKVKLNPVFVIMSDPKHVILRRVQPSEGLPLEVVHDLGLLVLGRDILGGKADHTRAVGPLVAASVDQGFGAVSVTAPDGQHQRGMDPRDGLATADFC